MLCVCAKMILLYSRHASCVRLVPQIGIGALLFSYLNSIRTKLTSHESDDRYMNIFAQVLGVYNCDL